MIHLVIYKTKFNSIRFRRRHLRTYMLQVVRLLLQEVLKLTYLQVMVTLLYQTLEIPLGSNTVDYLVVAGGGGGGGRVGGGGGAGGFRYC